MQWGSQGINHHKNKEALKWQQLITLLNLTAATRFGVVLYSSKKTFLSQLTLGDEVVDAGSATEHAIRKNLDVSTCVPTHHDSQTQQPDLTLKRHPTQDILFMVTMHTPIPSPGSTSGTSSPAPNAEGYLLLTIQHATVKQVFEGSSMTLAKGEMRVECISLPIPAAIGKQTANPFAPSPADPLVPTHDFWLVVHVGPTFEMPLVPESYLVPASSTSNGISYSIPSQDVPQASVELCLPLPTTSADMEDLDSFEVLLRQYRSLGAESTALTDITVPPVGAAKPSSSAPLPENMRGKVVLVNEDTGEVVGELDQNIDVEDEKKLAGDAKNRPVVLDFGNVVEGYAPKVTVQRIREEDMDDWMLKGAHTISKGILSFSSWSQKMMTSGADLIIRNTTPRQEPVKFSPTTKANIRRAHNASVKTVNVTKTTVGMINNAILKVVDKAYDHGVKPGLDAYRDMNADTKFSSNGGTPYYPSPQTAKSGPPPVPAKPGSLQASSYQGRTPSPLKEGLEGQEGLRQRINIPPTDGSEKALPTYTEAVSSEPGRMSNPSSPATTAAAKSKRPFLNRIVLAGEVVLSSLEATAHDLINTGTAASSSVAGHKYGPEAGHATALVGGSVRNVAVVYIDVRGVGRRALLKGTAKGFVKARLKNGEDIRLQGEGRDASGVQVEAGEVEQGAGGTTVVGMTEIARRGSTTYPFEKK